MNELISIIVPVYNVEQYLERCMKSLCGQTYTNIEIILVDDGSTDNSSQMCDTYAAQDNRIKVIHKQNGGLSDARNAGLAIATGAYIGFVDSDDWIEPDMYERMYRSCIEQQAQIAICRYAQIYQDKVVKEGTDVITEFSKEELLRVYICGHDDYVIYNSVWSKLFRRDLVEGVLFPTGRNSEDIMYTTKAFCKAEKSVYIDACFYNYVLDRQDSIMNVKAEERMFRDEIPFWKEHISYITEHVSKELGDLAAYYFYRRILSYYLRYKQSGNRHVAMRLQQLMQEEAEIIKKIYAEVDVPKGDRLRMALFLRNSEVYAMIEIMYAQCIVPIKQKIRRNR